MTIQEFGQQIVEEYPGLKACYIAVMEIDGQYDLEVEVSQGDIGGVFRTDIPIVIGTRPQIHWERVRALVDELDQTLTGAGVKVYQNRRVWENVGTEE